MKPKTKMEKYLVSLALKEHKINLDSIFPKVGYYTKTKVHCLACGTSYDFKRTDNKKYYCSTCKSNIKLIRSRNRTLNQEHYVDIIDAVDDIQILRTYFVYRRAKIGQNEIKKAVEVYRWYIVPDYMLKRTKRNAYLMAVYAPGYWYWGWDLNTKLELRNTRYYEYKCSQISIKVYKKKITKRFKYASYNPKMNVPIYQYFKNYLKYPELELIAKAGQYNLIEYAYHRGISILRSCKKEIRTVIKNKYKVKDWGMWQDYIEVLKFFGKDTTNKRWACPENLKRAHDVWFEKKELFIYEEENKEFVSRMKHYQNINFGNDVYEIYAFKDIYQVKHEGNILEHCVFKNEYHKKKGSLLLSVRKKEKIIATIEVDIVNLKILQIRGKNNYIIPEQETVRKLVEKNVLPFLRKLKKEAA